MDVLKERHELTLPQWSADTGEIEIVASVPPHGSGYPEIDLHEVPLVRIKAEDGARRVRLTLTEGDVLVIERMLAEARAKLRAVETGE